MAQETLNIVITADNKNALDNINQTIKSADNLGESLKRMPQASGQATQALVNLSRVAQDAPYGFIGIANNLNPLLESFQRLSERSKELKTSLGFELKNALVGPAGIGLALGVISSLLIKFGGDISKFISSLASGGAAARAYKESLAGIGSDFTSAIEKVNKVESAFSSYHKGLLTGQQALKIYNDELGKNFGVKKDINQAEETFKNKTTDYINASFQRALADVASKKAGEELLKQKLLEQKSLSEYKGFVGGATLSGQIDVVNFKQINQKTAQGFKDAEIKAQADIVSMYKNIFAKAKEESDKLAQQGGINFDPEKLLKPKKTDEKIDYGKEALKELNRAYFDFKRASDKFKELGGLDNIIFAETPEETASKEKKRLAAIKLFSDFKLDPEALQKAAPGLKGGGYLTPNAEIGEGFNDIEKVRKKMEAFKKTGKEIADVVNNSMIGAFMALGETVGTALSTGTLDFSAIAQMLADALMQIGQALITYAITSKLAIEALKNPLMWEVALVAGVAAIAAGAALKSTMSSGAKKMAEGGIVTHPTYAMVGEGGQSEAVMPLNKLGNMMNNTFNAGVMSNNAGGNGGGTVTLRGQDLLIALNRTQKASNLKGQSISLA